MRGRLKLQVYLFLPSGQAQKAGLPLSTYGLPHSRTQAPPREQGFEQTWQRLSQRLRAKTRAGTSHGMAPVKVYAAGRVPLHPFGWLYAVLGRCGGRDGERGEREREGAGNSYRQMNAVRAHVPTLQCSL